MNTLKNQQHNPICLVIEEKHKIIHLPQVLDSLSTPFTFRLCSDYHQASFILATENISLILFSIFRVGPNDLDAFSFYHRIRASYPIILMVHSQDRWVQLSFEEENVIDCLMKPVQLSRLKLAFHKFFRSQQPTSFTKPKDYLFLKMGRALRRFQFSEIQYVQAIGTQCTVFTPEGSFVVNETISELEKKLPSDSFSRIHKSYLVGLEHLVGYERNRALLHQTQLPIGSTYQKKIQHIFYLFT